MADKDIKRTEGLPQPPPEIVVAETKTPFDWKRVMFILIGLGLFLWIYFMPQWSDAVDPGGKHF
jgi:sodium-dependent dicarboxylate transporter 2/3/5